MGGGGGSYRTSLGTPVHTEVITFSPRIFYMEDGPDHFPSGYIMYVKVCAAACYTGGVSPVVDDLRSGDIVEHIVFQ